MGDILYALFFATMHLLLCMFFVNCFAEKRSISKRGICFYWIIWIALEMTLAMISMKFVIIRMILVPICSMVFIYLLQELSVLQSLFISIIFYGLGCVIDYAIYVIYNYIIDGYNIYIAENSLASFLLGVIGQMIEFVIISIISVFKGNYFFKTISKKDWLIFIIFPIFSIIVIFMLILNFGDIRNKSQNYTLMLISIGLLILNFFVLIIINEIMRRETQIRETQLMYERASNTAQKYFDKASSYVEQKKREHEFKNHLEVIYNLICHSEYERAKSYTEELSEQRDGYIDIIDMNHPIINSVVNTKYKEALAKGIFTTFDVCDIAKTSISDNDITIIISNLLNNAIEACEKDCSEDSLINFKVYKEDNNLYISVKNSCFHKPIFRNGMYITTKDDKAMHGTGIRNILDAVKRNKGEYVIDFKEDRFIFIICLPFQI